MNENPGKGQGMQIQDLLVVAYEHNHVDGIDIRRMGSLHNDLVELELGHVGFEGCIEVPRGRAAHSAQVSRKSFLCQIRIFLTKKKKERVYTNRWIGRIVIVVIIRHGVESAAVVEVEGVRGVFGVWREAVPHLISNNDTALMTMFRGTDCATSYFRNESKE